MISTVTDLSPSPARFELPRLSTLFLIVFNYLLLTENHYNCLLVFLSIAFSHSFLYDTFV